MVDYLTHFFRPEARPFHSLSALPDEEAIAIMEALYDESSLVLDRFKEPLTYLANRRMTEGWVRQQFIARGGQPQADYPHYMILGESRWIDQQRIPGDHAIQIPLSAFNETDLSFTYPDSMISYWFSQEKPDGLYMPEYHGKTFLMSEILAIVDQQGMPEESWGSELPPDLAPYIEAQIWNHDVLRR